MHKAGLIIVALLLALGGCGSSPDAPKGASAPKMSKELSQAKVDALKEQLTVIGKICPGISRYSAGITYKSYHKDPESGQVNLEFLVEDNAKIPNNYRAQGHTCFFRIMDGKLRINKLECLNICQDKVAAWNGNDVYLPLN